MRPSIARGGGRGKCRSLRHWAGLKATFTWRSLKSRIFGDFTRNLSKNGHFWGLAKMARPPPGARPSVNSGGFILKPKASIAHALGFFALWGPCRGFSFLLLS
jgi:hypothetical protein